MINQFKTTLFIGAFICIFFISCKKENSSIIQTNYQHSSNNLQSLVNQVKIWHDSTISSNLKSNKQNGPKAFSLNDNDIIPPYINWDNAFINYDSSDVKSITIPISMNDKNGEHIEFVATKNKNKFNGYFIKTTPDSAYHLNLIDIYNYHNFSGSISIYNLQGIKLKQQYFKSGNNLKTNTSVKNSFSNYVIYGDGYDTPKDLIEVTVKSVIKKSIYTYAYNYGYIYIDVVQNIESDQVEGGGEVIAGGIDFDYNVVPDGLCVFGALAHLGSILSVNKDPNYYLKQWADLNDMSLDNMYNKLISDRQSGPNINESIKLLNNNFVNYNLGTRDNMLKTITNTKIPVFVIIVWPSVLGGGGHAGIVKWSDEFKKIVFYDPVLNTTTFYENGTKEFDNSKYFFGVTMPI